MQVFCQLCDHGAEQRQDPGWKCPACARWTRWSTVPSTWFLSQPQTYTDNDRRFLRSLRIDAR